MRCNDPSRAEKYLKKFEEVKEVESPDNVAYFLFVKGKQLRSMGESQ